MPEVPGDGLYRFVGGDEREPHGLAAQPVGADPQVRADARFGDVGETRRVRGCACGDDRHVAQPVGPDDLARVEPDSGIGHCEHFVRRHQGVGPRRDGRGRALPRRREKSAPGRERGERGRGDHERGAARAGEEGGRQAGDQDRGKERRRGLLDDARGRHGGAAGERRLGKGGDDAEQSEGAEERDGKGGKLPGEKSHEGIPGASSAIV